MNLRDQIGSIAMGLTGNPLFVYGRKSEVNVIMDNAPKQTAVVLIEPDQFGFNVNPVNGVVRDTYNVFIQFIKVVDPMGEDANYRHPVVEEMRTLCAEFLQALSQTDLFQDLNPNIPGVLVVDAYDLNVAGIEINLAQLTDIYPRPC